MLFGSRVRNRPPRDVVLAKPKENILVGASYADRNLARRLSALDVLTHEPFPFPVRLRLPIGVDAFRKAPAKRSLWASIANEQAHAHSVLPTRR